jgi:shikimate dehydrogenase
MQLLLIGDPVGHSLSPAMHSAALAAAGLVGWTYTAETVHAGDLARVVASLRQREWAGANVTVPHKRAVMPLLDGITPVAAAIGAVNTVVKEADGRLIGHNTDAAGFLADLYALEAQFGKGPVLIIGAGGSARAVAAACAGVSARIRVIARRREQAEALQTIAPLEVFDWDPVGWLQASDDCTLIVNTTPLGMTPKPDFSPWLDGTPFPPMAFVYDLVYNPPETLLVQQAKAAGLRAATGLGMLVEQGALAFEKWTGHRAARTAMRRAAETVLATSGRVGAGVKEVG